MGKRKRSANSQNKEKQDRSSYNEIVKENQRFEKYYKALKICQTDEEFAEFLTVLRKDLPATFRITGSREEAFKMLEIIQGTFINDCLKESTNDIKAPNIFPIPWYPQNLAWQMELTRNDIRRCEAYYKLHNFLISETEHGTISRQEAVSMIPPLLLDIQQEHKILDMCAAPGSKTAQLLEILHASAGRGIPSGYVVANDVDNKRCYMLVHQAKRLNSPCVAITNHDSTVFPNFSVPGPDDSLQMIQFDRILCDVPCSGDGTMRKNPDIWMKWTPANALHLHGVQSRILRRGCELLNIGGRLVYSTCSLNPIENEAVIHRLLSETNDTFELLDVSNELPGLIYSQGMDNWTVANKYVEFFNNHNEVPEKLQTIITSHMFPPKPEDKDKYNLNRCIRILPHHQNTSAFFVAVLHKKGQIPSKSSISEPEPKTSTIPEKFTKISKRKRQKRCYNEDPFVFFNQDEPVWDDIKTFYQMSDTFNHKCLLTRCRIGKKRNIYLTSQPLRHLIINNLDRIKFINAGVKVFVRCDYRNMVCPFRVAHDGLLSIYADIGELRKINIGKEDLIILLAGTTPEKQPLISSLSDDFQQLVQQLSAGSCIFVYKEQLENSQEPFMVYASGWKGVSTMGTFMSQHSTVHLLRLLGADTSKFDVNKFKKEEANSSTQEPSV